jgi:hypothetical protein
MGGLLAACLLVALVVAPAVDAAVCAGDDRPAAVEASRISMAQAADHQAPHPIDAAGDCQHGHCHHVAPMLGGPIDAEPALIPTDIPPTASTARALASLALAGPERPPRA